MQTLRGKYREFTEALEDCHTAVTDRENQFRRFSSVAELNGKLIKLAEAMPPLGDALLNISRQLATLQSLLRNPETKQSQLWNLWEEIDAALEKVRSQKNKVALAACLIGAVGKIVNRRVLARELGKLGLDNLEITQIIQEIRDQSVNPILSVDARLFVWPISLLKPVSVRF
jgi:hypothetical protein